jgi:hypothetical protein
MSMSVEKEVALGRHLLIRREFAAVASRFIVKTRGSSFHTLFRETGGSRFPTQQTKQKKERSDRNDGRTQ